ncbi:hypothetical protein niasHS_002238 [Heterodera schachtii]|uniref:ER membrane protein complex subunit 4 n=1 Tax=Heterodera schachtii TaxID=97005 RepID=A0ABD2KMS4_HETSC
MASIPLANPMNKWRLDLCGSAGSRTLMLRSAAADQSLNPPGYNPGLSTTQQSESANRAEQQQQHLLSKRAWDLALQPVKSLPMNMFMMYMAGNTISIFPIMVGFHDYWSKLTFGRGMVGAMTDFPISDVNAAFKPLEQEHVGSLWIHKIVFALGNLCAIALAVYKCHTMGLLPNHASDWLDFVPPLERAQYALFNDI